jgi:AraC-like DNA-binding protein
VTQGAVGPAEIWSIRSLPKNLAPYLEFTQCPIRFGQSQSCVILSADSMDYALPSANKVRREELLAGLAARLALTSWGMVARVRNALRSLILQARTTMPEVARHRGLHSRTLRLALEREGTTFDAIKQEVRYAVARELLVLASLPVGDISVTLDFATPSSFVHAFRRWSNTTPANWRTGLQTS